MGIESNTAVIDVTHEQLKQLLGLFERYLPATAVWAFGSRAKWTSRPDSDLDLVVFANAEQARQISALREAFDESSLPFRIDLLVWEDLPKSFHQNISAQYVVLVEATPRSTNNATKWRKTKLGEVAGMVSQKVAADTITLENYVSTENMLPNFGGVQTSSNLPALDKFHGYLANDTLFSNIRTYFKKVWFADKSGGASADVLIFRSHDAGTLNPRFLSYLLCSQTFIDFSDLTAKGAKMPRGDKGAMLGFAFKLPPLAIQRAIAGVLGALDDKIALNRRMNATLEAMAQALFKDWFVDFGPVRAKMAGSAPTLDAELWDLFPSEIGADGVPVGWVKKPFGELIASNFGGDWGSEAADEVFTKPVSIIRGTDIPELIGGTKGKVPTRFTTIKKAEGRLLTEGDIVIEVSGGSPTQPTGRSIFVTNEILNRFENDMVCASFCRRLRPKSFADGILASQHLLFLYAKGGTWEYQNQSTGISNFQTSHFLENEQIIYPSEPILKAYLGVLEPIVRKMSTSESIELATLRDTLLPKLLSGEVRVDDLQSTALE